MDDLRSTKNVACSTRTLYMIWTTMLPDGYMESGNQTESLGPTSDDHERPE